MKSILFTSLVFVLSLTLSIPVCAQADIEASYLQHINEQNNLFLLKDNLPTAELYVVDFIMNDTYNREESVFFEALAKTYHLLEEYEKSFYYTLLNMCFYPKESELIVMRTVFIDRAYRAGLDSSSASEFYVMCHKNKIPESENERLIYLMEIAIKLDSRVLVQDINLLARKLVELKHSLPFWYQQWYFLTEIGMPINNLSENLDFESDMIGNVYDLNTEKLSKKAYRKSIRYYKDIQAKSVAKSLSKEYNATYPGFRSWTYYRLLFIY